MGRQVTITVSTMRNNVGVEYKYSAYYEEEEFNVLLNKLRKVLNRTQGWTKP
jgi:hypothetical protein